MSTLLKGIRVVELGLILPGAALGNVLADQGADVVKVEPPGGDYVRYFPEQVGADGGHSFWHLVLNRGKRSVVVDLRQPQGHDVLHDLVRTADVFVTNLIGDQPARLGASYEDLRTVKRDLVYCQLTGFGATGPYAVLPSHGLAMSSVTGQCVLERDADGWLQQVSDKSFGGGIQCAGQPVQLGPIWAAYGIAAALLQRGRTGEGAFLDISNCEATLATGWVGLPIAVNPGAVHIAATSQSLELKSARHAFYETKDGKYVFVALIEPKFWTQFCSAVDRPDLMEGLQTDVAAFDPLDEARNARHRHELTSLFRTRTRDEWTALFLDRDLPCSPVNAADELADDPQLVARGAFLDVEHPVAGRFRMAAEPLRVRGEDRPLPAPAPEVGEHTAEVLAELGYSSARIESLRHQGVVQCGPA